MNYYSLNPFVVTFKAQTSTHSTGEHKCSNAEHSVVAKECKLAKVVDA